MYLQLTTRCNMTCKHCMFACIEQGEDMSEETWLAAVKFNAETDTHMTLGGGEPTMHPQFWDIVMMALSEKWIETLWLATNGAITDTAIRLANMARKGILCCALSQDEWHDPIDNDVLDAFGYHGQPLNWGMVNEHSNDKREIRSVSSIINAGRAQYYNINTTETKCDSGHIIKPNGNINLCMCPESPVVGTVFDGVSDAYWDDYTNGYCYKDYEGRDEC